MCTPTFSLAPHLSSSDMSVCFSHSERIRTHQFLLCAYTNLLPRTPPVLFRYVGVCKPQYRVAHLRLLDRHANLQAQGMKWSSQNEHGMKSSWGLSVHLTQLSVATCHACGTWMHSAARKTPGLTLSVALQCGRENKNHDYQITITWRPFATY